MYSNLSLKNGQENEMQFLICGTDLWPTVLINKLSGLLKSMNVGPSHHGMARPQVADGGTAYTAYYMEGSCDYI
jgi:hypothetical protein